MIITFYLTKFINISKIKINYIYHLLVVIYKLFKTTLHILFF